MKAELEKLLELETRSLEDQSARKRCLWQGTKVPSAQQHYWEKTRKISAWARIAFRKEKPSTGFGRGERGRELTGFFPTENCLYSLLSSDRETFAFAPDL